MIMAQEQAILKARQGLERMIQLVSPSAQPGRSIDQVERDLWPSVLAVGRHLLEAFVAGHGQGDLGPTCEHGGRPLRRLEPLPPRRYVSVFGELTIRRCVYGTREGQKHQVVPLDAVLGLPDGDWSYLLQEWDQAFCVQGSYEQSRRTVERVLKIGQSVRSLEQMNVSMSASVRPYGDAQRAPAADEEGSILVLTADGKGVPMRGPAGGSPPQGRRTKGPKAYQTRQACVGAVYTIAPFVRTADQVVEQWARQRCRSDRPAPQHKRVRAELTRPIEGVQVNGKDQIFGWFVEQVRGRNPSGTKPVVCLMDGDRALWKKLAHCLKGVICILDLFHVMQRLWAAAHCFYPEGSAAAQGFVTDRLRRILQGDVGRVIGGLRQMGTKHRLRGSRRRRLSEAIGYLHRNRRLMKYDQYLTAGYPIGSGVVEGACRHLVKDRMQQTGMRWRVPGAQAMLDLRAIYLNGDWEDFQRYRISQEHQRLYPYHDQLRKHYPLAA
jgi:hypothetical protein